MAGLVFDPTSTANWRPFQNGDLPTSGVTAATYGDSTHVAQVAVNAQGIVTGASNVAIAAGSGTVSDITSTGGTIAVTNGTGPTANVDLPNSGVAAGTYGGSTQVGQFAVSADGVITSASNISISGIAGTGLVKLFDSTLGAAAATIDTGAGGIASGHGDLVVFVVARTADAGATGGLTIRVNNDSGANYDNQQISANNATVAGASSLAATAWSAPNVHGDGGTAGYASSVRIEIPSYDQTTFNKTALLHEATPDGTAGNNWVILRALGWRSPAAISRIAVTVSSGANLKAGSRLVVYGTQ